MDLRSVLQIASPDRRVALAGVEGGALRVADRHPENHLGSRAGGGAAPGAILRDPN